MRRAQQLVGRNYGSGQKRQGTRKGRKGSQLYDGRRQHTKKAGTIRSCDEMFDIKVEQRMKASKAGKRFKICSGIRQWVRRTHG